MAFTQSLICGFIAVGITGNFDHIEGSGIPETKYVISGISIYKYMSLPTLFMKSIALIFAIGSGFFIGKEGPFIHLSACIAENLSKLSIFKRLH
jgi:H+/Cl- antiporter ClcA